MFGRDALLNIGFEADWRHIKEQKQNRIRQNNARENIKRRKHTYERGDRVMVSKDQNRKFGSPRFIGPYAVTTVHDNGTVQLSKATDGGAVIETWNIRNLKPC